MFLLCARGFGVESLYAYRKVYTEERRNGIGWGYDCDSCDEYWDGGLLAVLLDSSPLMLWNESRASVVVFVFRIEEEQQGAEQTNSHDH